MARSKQTATDRPDSSAGDAVTDPVEATAPLPDDEVVLGTQEPQDQPMTDPQPAASATEIPRRRGTFLPLALGGIVAAGLGAGAVLYALPSGWKPDAKTEAALSSLSQRVDQQAKDLAARPAATEPTDLAAQIGTLAARVAKAEDSAKEDTRQFAAAIASLNDRVTALETGLTRIEQTPSTGSAASDAAIASFQSELAALRDQIAAQKALADAAQGDIAKAAADAATRIKDAEEQAAKLRAEAAAASQRAAARTAIANLTEAIDAGAPLASAIAELTAAGVSVPADISDAAGGVASRDAIRDAFTVAARDALTVSIKATAPDTWTGRLGAFLRAETGARSLAPRDGSDPDAILSRAEADVVAGDLSKALGELEALPDAGKARMAEWIGMAKQRIELQQSVSALAATLN